MDQNQEKEKVLIARNNETGQIGAVTGQNPDGTPRMTDVKSANISDLVKFTKGQNPVEAFVSNFVRQAKNPTLFGFFSVNAEDFGTVGQGLGALLESPDANKEMLAPFKVEVSQESQAQRKYQPNDESGIDWAAFKENWGVDREQLEKSGDLEKMLNYGKSGLVKIQPTLAGEKIELDARLSLRKDDNGNVTLVPHFIHLEPNLEKEYRGHQFTKEDKDQLLNPGNLGRKHELTGKSGKKIASYVSLDRLTNEIVSLPIDKLHIRGNIGKSVLTKDEIETLKSGSPIINKEVTLREGKTFTTTLQVNADSRCVEFVPKAWQNHNKTERQQQPQRQQSGQKNSWTEENGIIRPISKWKDNHFTEQQKADYVAGKTVVLENAVDDKGQPCALYVKYRPELGRTVGSTKNTDLAQSVVPSNDSATQVAVNNDGKTNEATKNVREPLQQGQTAPKNDDQQKQQRKPGGSKV